MVLSDMLRMTFRGAARTLTALSECGIFDNGTDLFATSVIYNPELHRFSFIVFHVSYIRYGNTVKKYIDLILTRLSLTSNSILSLNIKIMGESLRILL